MLSPGFFAVLSIPRKLSFADIITQTSIIVYLIQHHFSWFKNYKLLILKLVPGASFASAKTISVFVDADLQLMMGIVAKSNACIYFCY